MGPRIGTTFLKQIAQLTYQALRMRKQDQAAQLLVDGVARIFKHDRTCFYLQNSFGNLDIGYANKPEVLQGSHVRNLPPTGPFQPVVEEGAFVFIPHIVSKKSYYVVDKNGNISKRRGKIMEKDYVPKFGRDNVDNSGIVFGPLSATDWNIGAFKSDNFINGRPIKPEDVSTEDFLAYVRIAADSVAASMNASRLLALRIALQEKHANLARSGRRWALSLLHDLRNSAHALISYPAIVNESLDDVQGNLARVMELIQGVQDPGLVQNITQLLTEASKELALDQNNIKTIYGQGQKLGNLTRFEFDRIIQGGELDYQPNYSTVSMFSTVERMITNFEDQGIDKFDISAESNIKIQTSPRDIELVIKELIRNAIKFRDKKKDKSTIKIAMLCENNQFKFSITDNGLGFPPEMAIRLFDELEHNVQGLDLEEEGIESSGYGLAEIKYVIEDLLGGKIWAESEGLGQGSTFTFTLPLDD